jgi:3-hydroxyacyl-CoA dehydrogenase
MRALFLSTAHFTLRHTPQVAWDIPAVDHALEWGFGWEMGPFRQMDAMGLEQVRAGFRNAGLDEPDLLSAAGEAFYRPIDGHQTVLTIDGGRVPLEEQPDILGLPDVRARGGTLRESDDASLLDLGDGVVLLEFHSKMNTIGEGTIRMLQEGMEWVERHACAGLVIGNDNPQVFSAGANLVPVLTLAQAGGWDELERMVDGFQQATMSIRRAPFPVVVAPFGMTLGGGAEFALHADQVQAWSELAIGLVEFGVGLIPAGGGTKELLFRFTADLQPYIEADLFEAARRAFTLITLAQTSTSAQEARSMGFLHAQDRITMNRQRLIADAKRAVLSLAPGYVPPPPATTRVLGRDTLGNLRYAIWSFQEAGQASEHDALIAEKLAWVLAGGDGPPRDISEQDLLDFEREAFLSLLGTAKTQERIVHTLKTGKPLRN